MSTALRETENYIDPYSLTAADILELIVEYRIDIKHQDTHILAVNYSEGTCLIGSGNCVSAAVRNWALSYNSLFQNGM